VPAGMDQRSDMTTENVEHDMSQLAASRAQCSKNLAASWTLDDNSLVGEMAIQLSLQCCAIFVFSLSLFSVGNMLMLAWWWCNDYGIRLVTYRSLF